MFRRYLATLSLVAIAALALVALFGFLIDPYRLFGILELKGLNAIKARPEHDLKEIKRNLFRQRDYNALIAGNSRAEVGFDPDNPALSRAGFLAFNLALPGTGLEDAMANVAYASRVRPPQVLVLGMEFLDFLVDPGARPYPPASTREDDEASSLLLRAKAIGTSRAFLDAIRTINVQRDQDTAILPPNGFNPLREYDLIARNDGYWALFQQRAIENAASYVRKPKSVRLRDGNIGPSFIRLEAFLHTVPDRTHLVIYPYHAQILLMFDAAGLRPAFDDWKRTLVDVVTRVNTSRAPQAQIIVWDFSGISDASAERIPPPNDRGSVTRWYWEAGHFKSALGDRILQQLFGATDFGVQLNFINVESHLVKSAIALAKFRAGNPQLATEVGELIDLAQRTRRASGPRP